jgi:hypothetical protein
MDVRVNTAIDLFAPNDIIHLWRVVRAFPVAAIEFITRAGPQDRRAAVRLHCFQVAQEQLRGVWPDLDLWLFTCHAAWQPNTRRTHYLRLWKSFEFGKIQIPSGERSDEVKVESADGVRYFGRVHLPAQEAEYACGVIGYGRTSFIVGSTTNAVPTLDERVLQAWQEDRSEVKRLADLARILCADGFLLFRPFGYFDDVEVGVDVLLTRELLEAARSRVRDHVE